MCVSDLFLIDWFVLSFCSLSSIFKHYRVTRVHDGSFIIAVENPVSEKWLQVLSPRS